MIKRYIYIYILFKMGVNMISHPFVLV